MEYIIPSFLRSTAKKETSSKESWYKIWFCKERKTGNDWNKTRQNKTTRCFRKADVAARFLKDELAGSVKTLVAVIRLEALSARRRLAAKEDRKNGVSGHPLWGKNSWDCVSDLMQKMWDIPKKKVLVRDRGGQIQKWRQRSEQTVRGNCLKTRSSKAQGRASERRAEGPWLSLTDDSQRGSGWIRRTKTLIMGPRKESR